MQDTTKRILAGLAIMIPLAGGRALAQQPRPGQTLQNPIVARGGLMQTAYEAAVSAPEAEAAVGGGEIPEVGDDFAARALTAQPDPTMSGYTDGENQWVQPQSVFTQAAQCPPARCCEVCRDGYCCPPDWYLEEGVRVLWRGRTRRIGLSFQLQFTPDFTPYLNGPQMTTRSANFDIAAGYYATVGHYLGRDAENRDHFVEFGYWGMNSWHERQEVVGRRVIEFGNAFGNLFSPIGQTPGVFDTPVGGFNRVDRHIITYDSDIQNLELNVWFRPRGRHDRLVLHPNGRWRRECQPEHYISYVIGMRGVAIDEEFGFFGRGIIDDAGGGSSQVDGDYIIRTTNRMFGFQVGGDIMQRNVRWAWGVRGKAATMINFADQRSRVVTRAAYIDPFVTTDLDETRFVRKDDLSVLGEIGIEGTYKIHPQVVIRMAYDWMWITGLALAPEQFQTQVDPPDEVNVNGLGFYQGLTATLEWLF